MAKRTYTQVVLDVEAQLAEILSRLPPVAVPPVVKPPADLPPVESPPVVTEPPASGPFPYTRSRPFDPPAIVSSAQELVASRLVAPFDRANMRGEQGVEKPLVYVPGGWPSAYTDMGSTGERDEIGLVADDVAEWLCDPSDLHTNNMLVWAESHGSVPVHWLDGEGRIISVETYPRATTLEASRFLPPDLLKFPTTSPIRPEGAHYPALCYVPFLATNDQYYLEELQFAASFPLISQNPNYRGFEKGLLYTGQTRGYAWNLRDLVSAYLATPQGDVPAPLLPKAYWARLIENNRLEFERRWVKNGDNNPLTGLHFAVELKIDAASCRPWMQDMLGFVMGWMVWTGDPLLSKWRSNYEWHMRQAIDRTSGKSGFPRSRCIQYQANTIGVTDMASLATVNGWAETDTGLLSTADGNNAYAQYLRGNLKMAVLNGVPDAADSFAWLDPQVTTVWGKWAV